MAKYEEPSFAFQHSTGERYAFGRYEHDVLKNDRLLARYWHDYRGDDQGIMFIDGMSDSLPMWRMTDFLAGGGPEPLALSQRAVEYLKERSATL